jgi:hypothetical protein
VIVDRAAIEAALPGYRLGRQLGRGGYGMVLAGENAVGRPFAIKVLPSLGPAGQRRRIRAPNRIRDRLRYRGTSGSPTTRPCARVLAAVLALEILG